MLEAARVTPLPTHAAPPTSTVCPTAPSRRLAGVRCS